MRTIKPITFPLGQGTATQLEVTIQSFPTNSSTASTYNRLLDSEGYQIGQSWTYTLTEQQYAAWGADNSVVEEFVAADKGIELI